MLSEFRAFIMRGNVLDLAIAVIIGAAFGAIVSSVTDDIIMPLIGAATGGLDFSSNFVRLGPLPEGYAGSPTDYAALKKAGAALLGYGQFITVTIKFLIIALIIFWLIRIANHMIGSRIGVPPPPPPPPEDVVLLTEIRDLLRSRTDAVQLNPQPLPPVETRT